MNYREEAEVWVQDTLSLRSLEETSAKVTDRVAREVSEDHVLNRCLERKVSPEGVTGDLIIQFQMLAPSTHIKM